MCIPCSHQTSGSAIQNSSHHPWGDTSIKGDLLKPIRRNRKHGTLPLAGQVKARAGLCTGTHEESVSAAQGQSHLPCPFLMSQINTLIFNPKGPS